VDLRHPATPRRLCQSHQRPLAVFHPPDLLRLQVLTDNPDDPDWAWLKWLPHVQHPTDTDAAGPVRMIYTQPDSLFDLAARGPHTPDSLPGGPFFVVVDLTGGPARRPQRLRAVGALPVS